MISPDTFFCRYCPHIDILFQCLRRSRQQSSHGQLRVQLTAMFWHSVLRLPHAAAGGRQKMRWPRAPAPMTDPCRQQFQSVVLERLCTTSREVAQHTCREHGCVMTHEVHVMQANKQYLQLHSHRTSLTTCGNKQTHTNHASPRPVLSLLPKTGIRCSMRGTARTSRQSTPEHRTLHGATLSSE